jgi:hypothetical protein
MIRLPSLYRPEQLAPPSASPSASWLLRPPLTRMVARRATSNNKTVKNAGADLHQPESDLRAKSKGQGRKVSSFGVVLLECGGIHVSRMMIKHEFVAGCRLWEKLPQSCHD